MEILSHQIEIILKFTTLKIGRSEKDHPVVAVHDSVYRAHETGASVENA